MMEFEFTYFPILGTTLTRELVESMVWVDESLPQLVPHRFVAWFISFPQGGQDGLLLGFNKPPVGIGEWEATNPMDLDTLDGVVVDLKPMVVEPGV